MTEIETPHDSWRKIVRSPLLQGFVLVVLAVTAALTLEFWDRFADPDAFYHVGMAQLAAEGTFPTQFPWLDLTTLQHAYGDLHFLYHLILVPFVTLLDPLIGMRVATILGVAFLTAAFFTLLRGLRVRGAFAFTILLLGGAGFLFRVHLAKAQGFALAILFLGLLALAKRAPFRIALAALFAAWTSSHWPVLAVAAIVYACSHVFATVLANPRFDRAFLRSIADGGVVIASAAAGVIIAHVVNPYFPEILTMAKQQILDIALVSTAIDARVGSEWAPFTLAELTAAVGYLLPLAALAFGGLLAHAIALVRAPTDERRDRFTATLTFAFLGVAFAALTLRSRRHIEFLVPILVAFVATGMQPLIAALWPQRVQIGWRRPGGVRRLLSSVVLAILVTGFSLGSTQAIVAQREIVGRGFPDDRFRGTAAFLAANARPGEVVFHGDWDDFPSLFLYNRTQRYLIGLDPRFALMEDPERFRTWLRLNRGEVPIGEAARTIRETFGTRFAVIATEQRALRQELDVDQFATRVYEDDDGAVFELR